MTPRESKVLTFISDYIRSHGGVAPTLDEICAGVGMASRGGVHSLVASLARQGFITRDPHKVRGLHMVNRLAGFTIAELEAEVARREQEWSAQCRAGAKVAVCGCGNRAETPEARDCQRHICPLRVGRAA